MKILCIVPARAGSKGIRNKNIQKIKGKTLIEIACRVALKSKLFEDIIVSTDSKKYLGFTKILKTKTPYLRPRNLSGDKISDLELIRHELKVYEKFFKKKYDFVALLQPTCPLRRIQHLKDCYKILKNKKCDAVWTVSEISLKYNPLKQLEIKNERLSYCNKNGSKIIARQQLKRTFIRNGAAYFFSRKTILNYKKILPKKTYYKIITDKLINIDNKEDLKSAQKYLSSSNS